MNTLVSPDSKSSTRRLTTQNLNGLESGAMGSLHETDIFKICVKTLQMSQVNMILPAGS